MTRLSRHCANYFYIFTGCAILIFISLHSSEEHVTIVYKRSSEQERPKFTAPPKACQPVTLQEVIRQNSQPIRKLDYGNTTSFKNYCNKNRRCIRGFANVKHDQYLWTFPKSKTLVCQIKKNMSQLLLSIFCFLNDELDFLYGGKSLTGDVFNQGCGANKYPSQQKAMKGIKDTKGWNSMVLVREPVDRILSTFMHFCVVGDYIEPNVCEKRCHGCGVNMTCFLENQWLLLRKMSGKPEKKLGEITEHAYPQTWRCGFTAKNVKNYTILRYYSDVSSFFPQIKRYLESHGTSKKALNYIKTSMKNERTPHSTVLLSHRQYLEKRLRSSSYLMDIVMHMFYYDYTAFGFKFPKIPME
ncbi:unnamed protein product [Bursaphelenchus xylophilus]|uniref:(pine wood nematode) hypothetical protein n=1 Tax=Bursaphelenchus xylophilus TaxID=6326 RepID=A0A7I8WUD8_BURXY|nr:unnamed protein product [Bursaphelenchus xylophilus]CAG9116712.1 unnamed protein product [Bursaphelenchus xylophilus]